MMMEGGDRFKKAFVIGWPISHSLSPILHGYWLSKMNLSGIYEAVPVAPGEISNFFNSAIEKGYVGGNVTIPHKEGVFAIVDEKDEVSKAIGAVNTVWFEDNRLMATNTDATGFISNLDDCAPKWRSGTTALILGAGGASRAVICGILAAGYQTAHIINRTEERAKELVDRFGEKCFAHTWDAFELLAPDADLLVNTTSIGMTGNAETSLPSLDKLPKHCIVSDIVYTPLKTKLLTEAWKRDLQTVDGIGMLLHQAAPGFEKWFGVLPKVDKGLREHVLAAMEQKGNSK